MAAPPHGPPWPGAPRYWPWGSELPDAWRDEARAYASANANCPMRPMATAKGGACVDGAARAIERHWRRMVDHTIAIDERSELGDELNAASVAMPFSAVLKLRTMGMPGPLAAAMQGRGDMGVARVSLCARGSLYEPEGPDQRLLIAVRAETGFLEDIVAVAGHRRDEWALRRGVGWCLGEWRIDAAMRTAFVRGRASLRLFANPIDWLIGGCAGICVLDWTASALGVLRQLGQNVSIDVDPGARERLKALLAYGGLPRVREVSSEWERAA